VKGGGTDHQGIGRREALQACRQVGCLAERQLFLPGPAPDLPDDHQPRMDPQTDGELHAAFLGQAGIEWPHGLHHPQAGPHRPLGVIFMRQGVAEVDEQAVAQILGDMALIVGDHLGARVLIGPHHVAQVFRIKLSGEHRRIHQVTKEHGELAPFGFRERRSG
jgi:hypothetical protein